MVLSNRRLKQKLREALAQSLVESVAKTDPKIDVPETPDPNSQPQSLKVLLDSATQKPRLSKREKRRKVLALRGSEAVSENGSGGNLEENQGEDEKKEVGSLGDVKKKKRKRDEEEKNGALSSEENEGLKESKKPKKKNKKKAKKRKKEEKSEEEKRGDELRSEEKTVKETNNTDRQANGDVPTKVYVGGIPYYSTEDDIRSYFESCGTITEIDCMRFPESGKFRGIAIISFKTEAAAKRALALDGAEMGELFLKIQPYKATRSTTKVSDFAPQIVEGYNRIYVGNLSWDITEDDLKKLFSDCKISSINFGMDKETGEFRGYAHVNFSDSLSLTMALKLDQKVVCGRPVKISCAVPLRKAGTQSMSAPTTTTTHSVATTTNPGKGADINGLSAVSGKFKRRTCYECGEKGHVSSACPKKQSADPEDTNAHSISVATTTTNSIPIATTTDIVTIADINGFSTVSGKIKRRTCYECGEKGHVSSACPKKESADPIDTNAHSISVATTTTDPIPIATTPGTGADINGLSAISGKVKRRTCYECGEKGHVSSACPKKQSADQVGTNVRSKSVATSTDPIPTATSSTEPIPTATTITNPIPIATTAGTVADINGLSAVSGKIKRRTCYECGEKGHISSDCPKKQSADQ